jgi:hypothetical protein
MRLAVSRLRWLLPVWWAVVAIAAVFTRDDPPPFWWVFPGALALASWVVEWQESIIRDLFRLLGREQAVPGPVSDEELLAVADAAGVVAGPAVDGPG